MTTSTRNTTMMSWKKLMQIAIGNAPCWPTRVTSSILFIIFSIPSTHYITSIIFLSEKAWHWLIIIQIIQ
jgi:hypothetical protein